MKLSNKKTNKKGCAIAFCITGIYIITMLIMGIVLGDDFSVKISNVFALNGFDISIKYIGVISLSGLFIFIMTCLVIKRLDKDRAIINDDLNKIKEREETIEILSSGLDKQDKLIKDVLESVLVFVIRLDKDFNIINASENIKDIANFEAMDIKNRPLCMVINQRYVKEIRNGIWDADKYELEIQLDSKCGKRMYTYGRITKHMEEGEETEYTLVSYDITKRKDLQRRLRYLDSYDALTDLPNRNLMEKTFTSLRPRINKDEKLAAFLYLDIDNLTLINETKGHNVGDLLLVHMANLLKDIIEDTDILGRITQDKFAIIVTGKKTSKEIDKKIKKIVKATNIEWEFEEKLYMVSATVGVSIYPKDGWGFIELLKNANLALECAKQSSRTGYEYYSEGKTCSIIQDLSIVSDIKVALKEGQFEMHYQPICNLKTDRIENLEALIRWNHPENGYIPPDQFIPAAERSWIIDDIGEYTLEEVFRQKVRWNKEGCKLDKVSINISAISFGKVRFGEYIEEKLGRYELEGSEIVLELTESGFSNNETQIKKNIEYLRNLGVRISMDDFGTGHSSLARLKELQIDDIKLDRTFVASLLEENGQEIIKILIALAKALGKDVVAEGIETEEQCIILKELGSKYGQGYYLSRPMCTNHITELLKKEEAYEEVCID